MSATTQRLAPRRGTRRGPTVGHRPIPRRTGTDRQFLSFRPGPKLSTLQEVVQLTWAAMESGSPAPCLICERGVMTTDGCGSCGSQLS